ncbi:hypothetical protein, partial [Pseudomonas sp. G(2018)]|uniref:hypothetical protein n=1 Tax=Pseudomonas sp. G(2018) TaxID=2502242 RepID=UPI001484C870
PPREIRVRKPLPNIKISISDAYFSDAQTKADFFNRIGRFLPLTEGRYGAFFAGQDHEECWSSQMQMADFSQSGAIMTASVILMNSSFVSTASRAPRIVGDTLSNVRSPFGIKQAREPTQQ